MKRIYDYVICLVLFLLLTSPLYALAQLPADINGNGCVEIFDFNSLIATFGKKNTGLAGDIDKDDDVDIFDFNILVNQFGQCNQTQSPTATPFIQPSPTKPIITPPPGTSGGSIWIQKSRLAQLPTTGSSWNNLKQEADSSAGTPDLSNQDDPTNVKIMAKALVYARTNDNKYKSEVEQALTSIISTDTYNGRALALGRELVGYVIAADLVDLKNNNPSLDAQFKTKIKQLVTTPTSGGPSNLIKCHEERPNNWGTHCGASRLAVALYLQDSTEISRSVQVLKGWLGDRSSYGGFSYGDTSWQCNPSQPVGINPVGCQKQGHSIDGVLPDDQRRCGGFGWPPCLTNYSWEGLQGIWAQAVMLHEKGYDVFNWENQAILRAVKWLYNEAKHPASSDDSWQLPLVDYYFGTSYYSGSATSPGKNVGWTDWTHQ